MFLHTLLHALLTLLHQLLSFLALLRSEHSINLRFGALLFHDQIAHDLALLVGESAGLVLIKAARYVCVFRLPVLPHLLHQRLQLAFLRLHDALDLGLLVRGQVQLFGHVLEHPTAVVPESPAKILACPLGQHGSGHTGGHNQYDRGYAEEKFLLHHRTPFTIPSGSRGHVAIRSGLPLVLTLALDQEGYELLNPWAGTLTVLNKATIFEGFMVTSWSQCCSLMMTRS